MSRHLLLAYSYEERSLSYLRSFVAEERPGHVTALHFMDYDAPLDVGADKLDIDARQQYFARVGEAGRILDGSHTPLSVPFDSVHLLLQSLATRVDPSEHLIIDISCLPRMQLAAILAWVLQAGISCDLAYTRVQQHLADEARFSVGVKGFAGVPALTGQIRHRRSTAIFALGFEGNRAYATFKHLSPDAAVALIGVPSDNARRFYEETVEANNHYLLVRERVQTRLVASLDPVAFAADLYHTATSADVQASSNVYWTCLGTKLQAVAGVLASEYAPFIQHVFPLPSHRRVSSVGVGATAMYSVAELRSRVARAVETCR